MSTLTDNQLLSFVRPLLRTSETAKVAAQGVIPADVKGKAQTASNPADAHENEQERRRVLAVVTSAGPAGSEEGSVFLYRRKPTGELVVASIVPITHDFQISVAQVAPDGDGADKRHARRTSQAPGKSGHFLVTVKSPSRDRELFLLSSSPSLKDVLAECRRLKGTAEAELSAQAPWNQTHHLTTSHAWLEHYQHQIMNISLGSVDGILKGDGSNLTSAQSLDEHSVPESLFHPPSLSVPLGKRLSPASAGLPPTDSGATADLILLRDEWVRQQLNKASKEIREKNAPGSSTIKLRICSYNVNGQNPPARGEATKALGSWIRTQPPGRVRASSLPPADSEASSVTAVSIDVDTKTTPPVTPKAPPTPARGATLPAPAKLDVTNVAIPDIVRTESPSETPIGHRAGAVHDDAMPDMLVVGFQELDLSTEALLYREDPAREEAWTAAIIESLGERADGDEYIKVASKQLVGMLIVLVATKTVRPRIRDVRTSSAAVGILGLMGNKGAVALRMRVDGTTLTFVSSHLAAFEEMHDKRNYDWREIARKLVFVSSGMADVAAAVVAEEKPPVFAASTPAAPSLSASVPGLETVASTPAVDATIVVAEDGREQNPLFDPKVVAASAVPVTEHLRLLEKATIWDSDCVFWNVHLNYRIDLPDLDVRELLGDTSHPTDKHNITTLLKWDQLKNSQRSAKVFEGFEEAQITFLPTYRFEFGLKADQNGYDIKRKPAWTDRILHMGSDAVNVQQTGYTSHPELLLSDHKPISATFDIEPDSMTNATRELLTKTLLHRLGDWILSDEQPNVKIDVQNVELGPVSFNVPVTRTFEVKNVGQAPCGFRFVSPAEDTAICEDWLSIEPQWGIILPGDAHTIQLTAHVTAANAARLNSGQHRLEDTLVLHALRGKDHFVAVGGSYNATCFANDLRWLSRLPCPIREFADPVNKKELLPEEQASNAPNEVMRLIAWLMSNALEEEGLFLSPGDPETMQSIREGLDTGAAFEDGLTSKDAGSVADVLVALLDSLPEPVIPWRMHAVCAEVADRDAAFELLADMPAVNRNVWVSLTAFLHFLVEHAAAEPNTKQQRTRALAAVFAPILLRDNLATAAVSPLGKRAFLLSFIQG